MVLYLLHGTLSEIYVYWEAKPCICRWIIIKNKLFLYLKKPHNCIRWNIEEIVNEYIYIYAISEDQCSELRI